LAKSSIFSALTLRPKRFLIIFVAGFETQNKFFRWFRYDNETTVHLHWVIKT
jgi:hypothetical protein